MAARVPTTPLVRPLGDAAVLVELGTTVDLAISRRVHALAARVARSTGGEAGWGMPVPGACSVLVPVDPLDPGVGAATARLSELVRGLLEGPASDPEAAADTPVIEIRTRYGGPDGPDLEMVSEMTGLSPAEVVDRHVNGSYVALFLGFAPGFAYLGPLPTELSVARRPVPRTHVPAGSVGIAGSQTAVYPIDSPGGWWIIGRTEAVLWEPSRDPPALLRPGDRVRFVPEVGPG